MNRLQHEISPYLLQHANNPVDWHAWKPEAFEKAKAEDQLILVSMGVLATFKREKHGRRHKYFHLPGIRLLATR